MLFVQIYLDEYRYIISTSSIVEIIPGVNLTPFPGVPSYIAGICSFRGKSVPVIDLCELFLNRPSEKKFSTRIIFVNAEQKNGEKKLVGLLAEKVTETIKVDEESFIHPGVHNSDKPFIGDVVSDGKGLVSRILTREIFNKIDSKLLFGAA